MNASEQHPSKFKAAIKELLPAYIITFTFCYMLFVYEPILMYSTNQLDFWFDLALMAGPMLIGFAMFFFGSAVIMTAVFLINKTIVKGKDPIVYWVMTILLFLVFFVTYIQGNFLAGDLPALDGSVINWNGLEKNDIFTFVIEILVSVVIIFLIVNLNVKRTFHITAIAAGAIFVIITISLLVTVISWNAFARKDGVITTSKDFDTISSDKNFLILLNDAIGSTEFWSVLEENPEYKEVFEDFTYFPDTLGCYPCTRDTIPLVLSGGLNKNEMEFEDFSSQSLNKSPFFRELTEKGYDIDLYEAELIWYGAKEFNVNNSADYGNYRLPFRSFFREEMKYIGYKYLPYRLKRYSNIESMDFNGLVEKYIWDDRTIYSLVKNKPNMVKTSDRIFKLVHTEGAHIPFKYDKDLNILDDYGTYEQKIEATITMLKAYLERLKANEAYDNTVIIVMADHGNTDLNSSDDMLVRANPMFMIKGINERHEFEVSEKPLSYLDLMDIYSRLLDDKTAREATSDIPDKRERIFMWYRNFRLEHHIKEYVVTDKAWEWRKFRLTGNEYVL